VDGCADTLQYVRLDRKIIGEFHPFAVLGPAHKLKSILRQRHRV
jgi:hypothetical protein